MLRKSVGCAKVPVSVHPVGGSWWWPAGWAAGKHFLPASWSTAAVAEGVEVSIWKCPCSPL